MAVQRTAMEHTTRHPYSIVGVYPVEREGRELDVVTIVRDFPCHSDASDYSEQISWGVPLDISDGTLNWNLVLTSATLSDTEVTLVGIGSRFTKLTVLPVSAALPFRVSVQLITTVGVSNEINTNRPGMVILSPIRWQAGMFGRQSKRSAFISAIEAGREWSVPSERQSSSAEVESFDLQS